MRRKLRARPCACAVATRLNCRHSRSVLNGNEQRGKEHSLFVPSFLPFARLLFSTASERFWNEWRVHELGQTSDLTELPGLVQLPGRLKATAFKVPLARSQQRCRNKILELLKKNNARTSSKFLTTGGFLSEETVSRGWVGSSEVCSTKMGFVRKLSNFLLWCCNCDRQF